MMESFIQMVAIAFCGAVVLILVALIGNYIRRRWKK